MQGRVAAQVCKQELAALGGGGFQSVLYLESLHSRRGQLLFLSFRVLFMRAVCGVGWLCAGIALRFVPACLLGLRYASSQPTSLFIINLINVIHNQRQHFRKRNR